MTFQIIIYTASGRNLTEKQADEEQCIETMEKIERAIENEETFWFGRSRVHSRCIEAFFATSDEGFYDDEARRVDPKELIEGHEFIQIGGVCEPIYDKGMWGSLR